MRSPPGKRSEAVDKAVDAACLAFCPDIALSVSGSLRCKSRPTYKLDATPVQQTPNTSVEAQDPPPLPATGLAGRRCVLIAGEVASGGAVHRCLQALEDRQIELAGIVVVFDREENWEDDGRHLSAVDRLRDRVGANKVTVLASFTDLCAFLLSPTMKDEVKQWCAAMREGDRERCAVGRLCLTRVRITGFCSLRG